MGATGTLGDLELKSWEKALIACAAALFMASAYLYLTDYPLREYLFQIEAEKGLRVGVVSVKDGLLRRQVNGESEFKALDADNVLFNEDTVVTGPDGSATLQMDDGSTIELAANTMVRLRFERGLSLGGISRATNVDVVTGNVTGAANASKIVIRSKEGVVSIPKASKRTVAGPKVQAPIARSAVTVAAVPQVTAQPVPTVSPLPTIETALAEKVEMLTPRVNQRFTLPRGAKVAELPVAITWRVSPPNRRVIVSVRKLVQKGRGQAMAREEVLTETVDDVKGLGKAGVVLRSPGLFEWELRGVGDRQIGAKASVSRFWVDPNFESIELLEPLVGGELGRSNRIQGKQLKQFDITFRWNPFPGATRYKVAVRSRPDAASPVLEKVVERNQYSFNKDKVFTGTVYYDVSTRLESGFVAHSRRGEFSYNFLAPHLVMPEDKAVFTRAQLASEGNSILLTWQKTNFTDFYQIEIARDAGFASILKRVDLKENFYVLKSPASGTYYWRVRSSAKSAFSPPSDVYSLTVAGGGQSF